MSPSRPPDVRVAEVLLEPDESNAATLAHLRQHAAVLPAALDGIVDMWQPHGWAGQLDGRPVLGSLDGFDDGERDPQTGSVLRSATIERCGSWELCVIVSYVLHPSTLKVTAQALTQEHADRIADAARTAWTDPPPVPTRRTRLERAGRWDSRRRAARAWTRRKAVPRLANYLLGAVLVAAGVTAIVEGWVSVVLDWLTNP